MKKLPQTVKTKFMKELLKFGCFDSAKQPKKQNGFCEKVVVRTDFFGVHTKELDF